VYPFVRSYDWYLLPDEDRRRMLADHGKMARGFPDVRANTVASFALGDYEWLLAFEADELHRIVDLMRHLRASEARLHVREEVPFYTGRRKPVAELVAGLA
jgi:chlorite dismutase